MESRKAARSKAVASPPLGKPQGGSSPNQTLLSAPGYLSKVKSKPQPSTADQGERFLKVS